MRRPNARRRSSCVGLRLAMLPDARASLSPQLNAAAPGRRPRQASTPTSPTGGSFIEARMKRDPYFAVQAGRHEFDGQMPDWSRAAHRGGCHRAARVQVETAPARCRDAQRARRRFERDYLAWVIDSQTVLAGQRRGALPQSGVVSGAPRSLHVSRRANTRRCRNGWRASSATRARSPDSRRHIRANLRTPLPKAFIERGAAGFGGYATFFRDEMPPIFAGSTTRS